MIASLGDDRNRYRTTEDFQAAAGIAPLTDQSGGSLRVYARWAATLFIKQTFHEYAGLSIAACPGLSATMNCKYREASQSKRPDVLWLTNGFASSIDAGKTVNLITSFTT